MTLVNVRLIPGKISTESGVCSKDGGSDECSAVLTVQGQCARIRPCFSTSHPHAWASALHGISLLSFHF